MYIAYAYGGAGHGCRIRLAGNLERLRMCCVALVQAPLGLVGGRVSELDKINLDKNF